MQPPSRDGRGGNNARSQNGGFPAFPAFPAFPDPFAGFGGRPGFLSDMFDNDPFNDPFFTRPFGAPFGSGGGLFGPSGFFNQGLFGSRQGQMGSLDQRPFSSGMGQGQANLLDQRAYNTPPPVKRGKKTKKVTKKVHPGNAAPVAEPNRRNIQIEEGTRRGVQIEELPDDHDIEGDGQPSTNEEPIVEHPDDEERTDTSHNQPRNMLVTTTPRRQSRGPLQSGNNPVRSYSFQSSSVMYGGANGPYYAAQTTRKQGPDGVIEEEHQEKDSTTGNATHRLSRGLFDKGRSLTRKRNAEGREEKLETLHNLGEDEVPDFERSWETAAEKSLPRWNKNSSQRLSSSSKARPALPSIGGGSRENRD